MNIDPSSVYHSTGSRSVLRNGDRRSTDQRSTADGLGLVGGEDDRQVHDDKWIIVERKWKKNRTTAETVIL